MNVSSYYAAAKINALRDRLQSTACILRRKHQVKNHSYISYSYLDPSTGKRHEHIDSSPNGKHLEQLYRERLTIKAELERWQIIWDSTFATPIPYLDISSLRITKKSIITKDFFDSLISSSNPKPIARPNPYKGIVFRSKSEREIAEILDELAIEYKYEPRIPVNDYEIYADFVCFIRELGIGFIIEHCGLMDSPAYVDKTIRTFRDYIGLGFLPSIHVLFTYEKSNLPPTREYFRSQINRILDSLCSP